MNILIIQPQFLLVKSVFASTDPRFADQAKPALTHCLSRLLKISAD